MWRVAALLSWPLLALGYGQKEAKEVRNFQELYEEGREAYLENRFHECVKLFEAALRDYRLYTRVLVDCKAKCKVKESALALHSQDMLHYQRMIQETLCNMKCKLAALPSSRPETVREEIRTYFEERKPYDFLQLCYYQTGRHQAAATAAFTNLAANPEAEVMRENLNFYLALPDVNKAEVVDLEAKPWVAPYLAGQKHYTLEQWGEMVEAMEESLRLYLREEEECRLQCDKPFDQKWYPDFTSSVANHFTFCLKCRRNCPEILNSLNGEFTEDLVASFYHYLQFGYYKVGEVGRAAEAATTFLLLVPDHQDMQANLDYYTQVEGVMEASLHPREEARDYVNREEDEEKLLDFITNSFVFNETKSEEQNNQMEENPEELGSSLKKGEFISKTRRRRRRRWPEFHGSPVRRQEDGLVDQERCDALLRLADLVAQPGDGYLNTPMDSGEANPHSPAELLTGVTVGKLALFVAYGLVGVEELVGLLEAGEVVRRRSQELVSPNATLYCTYTHLVCRQATPGPKVRERSDLSHEVHADNCTVQGATCDPSPPAYHYRSVSALLYLSSLHSHFTGGRFFFARRAAGGRAFEATGWVAPRCGRLLAFTSGQENLHGVQQVAAGRRCALALWFSHDPDYWEPEIGLAWDVVEAVRAGASPSTELIHQLEELTMFSEGEARRVTQSNRRPPSP